MDQLLAAAESGTRPGQHIQHAAGIAGAETPAGEEQALRERVPRSRLPVRAELGEHAVNMGAELLMRYVTAAVAHQQRLPGQQPPR